MAGLNKQSQEIMARLQSLISMQEACIKADPMPTIKKAFTTIGELQHVLSEVYDALTHSDIVFDAAQNYGVRPDMLRGEDLIRNRKAREILNKHFYGQ